MSTSTRIEWTDKTWNPVVGCTRVSAGCDHCYAVRQTHRLAGMHRPEYRGLTVLNGKGDRHFNGTVRCLPERLADPLHWRKRCRVFVNSMSDLFHEKVPFEFVMKVWAAMKMSPSHTFQILTKRPGIAKEFIAEHLTAHWLMQACDDLVFSATWMSDSQQRQFSHIAHRDPHTLVLPNVWLGTSIEDQVTADERIWHLLRCPAAVRFLSCEPLLGPIDIGETDGADEWWQSNGIGWVIVGGESGPGARPMHPDWVRSIRDQCVAAGVPFFFKQWGEYIQVENLNHTRGWDFVRVGKKRAGAMLDGREWRHFPANLVDAKAGSAQT